MTVVQIFDQTTPLVSGYSMRSLAITKALAGLRVPLLVFTSPIFSYENSEDEFDGVPYVHGKLRAWPLITRLPFIKESLVIRSLTSTIRCHWHEDTQLIDAHSSVLNGIAGYKTARAYKVPLLYEIRAFWEDAAVDQGKTQEGSWRYNYTRHLETDIARKANRVTVICDGLKKDLMERGIPEDKITVIPNGVDIDRFQPAAEPDQELVTKYRLKGHRVIGFIGTFFRFEGLDLLIKAARAIATRDRNVRFLLVGGGEMAVELQDRVREYGLTDVVLFSGRVPHEDVTRYYSLIDILVYPRISRRITELVTPLKPLEAMALKKIIIGSNVGGIKELVHNDVNGILFEKGNVLDLTDKCEFALRHLDDLQVMASNARQYVEKERTWSEIVKIYLPLFKDLGVSL
jgi:PEP-CTERM/exosortase A-associated glycosyltransferase